MYNPPSSVIFSFNYFAMQWTTTSLCFSEYFFLTSPSTISSHKKRQLFVSSFSLTFFPCSLFPFPLLSLHYTPYFFSFCISHSLPSKFPSIHDNAPQFPLLRFPTILPTLASGPVLKLANQKLAPFRGKMSGDRIQHSRTCTNTVGSSSGSAVLCW